LERFGLAERHGPAVWTLRPGMEETLRDPATSCASQVSDWFLDSPAGIPDGLGNIKAALEQHDLGDNTDDALVTIEYWDRGAERYVMSNPRSVEISPVVGPARLREATYDPQGRLASFTVNARPS